MLLPRASLQWYMSWVRVLCSGPTREPRRQNATRRAAEELQIAARVSVKHCLFPLQQSSFRNNKSQSYTLTTPISHLPTSLDISTFILHTQTHRFAGWTTPRTPQAAWKPVMYKAEQWYYLKGHNNFGDAGPYGGGPYSGVGPFPVAHPPGAPPPIPQAGGGHGGVPHFGGGHAPGSSVGGGTQLPGAGGDPYAPASVASSRRSGGGSTVSGGGGSSRGSERSATPIYRSDGRGDGGGRRRRGSRERMSRVDEDSE